MTERTQEEIDRLWDVKVEMARLLNKHSEDCLPDLIRLLDKEMKNFDAQAVDMLFVELDLEFSKNALFREFLLRHKQMFIDFSKLPLSFRAGVRLEYMKNIVLD